jgi:Tfp pilus assembly protein PilO
MKLSLPGRFDIREKAATVIVVLAVWLVANVAVASLVNIPRAETARTLRRAIEESEVKFRKRKEKVDDVRAEYERVRSGQQTLQTFYDQVLSTKRQRMTSVQKEVRDIATKFQITAESINYATDFYKGEKVVKFSAILPLNGSYENLRSFVSAVENSENFLVIDSITLTDSKEGGVILTLQITLSTFFVDPDIDVTGTQPTATGG